MIYLQEKLLHCPKCGRVTRHFRNATKAGGMMLAFHIIMTFMTGGFWLLLLGLWKITGGRPGEWHCGECK